MNALEEAHRERLNAIEEANRERLNAIENANGERLKTIEEAHIERLRETEATHDAHLHAMEDVHRMRFKATEDMAKEQMEAIKHELTIARDQVRDLGHIRVENEDQIRDLTTQLEACRTDKHRMSEKLQDTMDALERMTGAYKLVAREKQWMEDAEQVTAMRTTHVQARTEHERMDEMHRHEDAKDALKKYYMETFSPVSPPMQTLSSSSLSSSSLPLPSLSSSSSSHMEQHGTHTIKIEGHDKNAVSSSVSVEPMPDDVPTAPSADEALATKAPTANIRTNMIKHDPQNDPDAIRATVMTVVEDTSMVMNHAMRGRRNPVHFTDMFDFARPYSTRQRPPELVSFDTKKPVFRHWIYLSIYR
jgi:hypothetical protein